MTPRVVGLAALGGCLAWLAAGAPPAVPGLRRWRWGTPGGRTAVLAGACGVVFPLLCGTLSAAVVAWPRSPPRWFTDVFDDLFVPLGLLGAGAASGAILLQIVAARRAVAAADEGELR